MIEFKDIGEAFTPQQKVFHKELGQGKHRPHRKGDYLKVTPKTCGCP